MDDVMLSTDGIVLAFLFLIAAVMKLFFSSLLTYYALVVFTGSL
jgi:hypothetical protein